MDSKEGRSLWTWKDPLSGRENPLTTSCYPYSVMGVWA